MAKPYSSALLLTSLIFFHFSSAETFTNPDLEPLFEFKSGADQANRLASWNSTANPCSWAGVFCVKSRVSRLVLENLQLSGSFEPLTSLTELRVLSLKRNEFTGSVPNLSNLTSLKLLFLSHNRFDGRFPDSVDSLVRLYRLDLSFNNFSGEIPISVNHLPHLLTLRLEGNRFSGPISGLNLPKIQDFNVSGNHLSGGIPDSLSVFPESAFSRNEALCGSPIQKCDAIPSDPTRPGSAFASPFMPATVASSPTSVPKSGNPVGRPNTSRNAKMSPVAVIAIILADVLVLTVVSLILYCYFWRNFASKTRDGRVVEGEKIVYSSSPYPVLSGLDRGKMVFFEGAKRFELEDLLRASAEMLGKGGCGTAYKAVLDDGSVVAVKRLKDANFGAKRELEQHMEVLGRLRHPNVVSLKAYYFAREEKLLVYDYMANGSLFWLLHGNRGPGRIPLDWTTRLKIAAGAAHGVAFIHTTCKTLKLTHGNIKSTNVLLDKAGNACVSDFGLSIFAFPAANAPRTNGYRAPELTSDARKPPTNKSDVYSFGVLLLELLTGKCPSLADGGSGYGGPVDLPRWVQSVVREEWTAEVFDLELMRYKDIEEEMVGLLQVAMACTAASPDQRPKMSHVVRMIEEIGRMEVSPSHDNFDSVSESPCLSEETCGNASQ